ncbi:MAG TPA: tRNA lysidine(34) synthetase TilS [Dongiaceae bacterium]|nr:tRNA lysidine(34) synthetase TilS [Dongiaceae bacterium]
MSSGRLQEAFAAAMKVLGAFEPSPHIAVAVSGGSDSLALLLLLRDWVAERDGRLTALSVDHGLRPESAGECRQVGAIVARLNKKPHGDGVSGAPDIDHHVLVWQGDKPATGVMAAARAARYRLLCNWCRAHDVLHLALAHHADDLVETVLMRADHGSGAAGLAGMAALRPTDGVRVLRPLLGFRKSDLIGCLEAAGLDWIEDPSNRAPRFERVRWRQQLAGGADLASILDEAGRAGRHRDCLERAAGRWLAEYARIDPLGYLTLPIDALGTVAPDVIVQILYQGCRMVGGGAYPPAPAGLQQMVRKLRDEDSPKQASFTLTLAGCLLVIHGGMARIYREATGGGEIAPPANGDHAINWDRRFIVRWPAPAASIGREDDSKLSTLEVAPVGKHGFDDRTLPPELKAVAYQARASLPALWQAHRLIGIARVRGDRRAIEAQRDHPYTPFHRLEVSFLPAQPATSCGFTVVLPPGHTM